LHIRQLADVSRSDQRTTGGLRRPLVKMERSDILANVRRYAEFWSFQGHQQAPLDISGVYGIIILEKGFWPWLLPQIGRKFFFVFSYQET